MLQSLTTTITAGVLALALVISMTVLLVVGETVPGFMEPTLAVLIGIAIGGANKVPPGV